MDRLQWISLTFFFLGLLFPHLETYIYHDRTKLDYDGTYVKQSHLYY